jgi:hypothetical protein
LYEISWHGKIRDSGGYMEWLQVFTLFLANAGLIIWFRTESRSDWRHCDAQIAAIQQEMKDFHGRLCAIEERKKND